MANTQVPFGGTGGRKSVLPAVMSSIPEDEGSMPARPNTTGTLGLSSPGGMFGAGVNRRGSSAGGNNSNQNLASWGNLLNATGSMPSPNTGVLNKSKLSYRDIMKG